MSFLLIFGTAKNILLEQTPLMMMATTNFPSNYRPISNNRTWTSESIVCSCSCSAPREEADDESVMSRFNGGLELAAGASVGFPRQTSRGYWTRRVVGVTGHARYKHYFAHWNGTGCLKQYIVEKLVCLYKDKLQKQELRQFNVFSLLI